MDKIIQFALSTKFGQDIEPIMEVIAATGNPTVATEILLGLYTDPEIPGMDSVFDNDKDNKVNIKYMFYDRFKDELSYSYQRVNRKSAWFKKGDMPVKENIVSDRYWSEDAAKQVKMTEEDFKAAHELIEYEIEIQDRIQTDSKCLGGWCDYITKCTEVIQAEPDLATLADQQYEAQLSM